MRLFKYLLICLVILFYANGVNIVYTFLTTDVGRQSYVGEAFHTYMIVFAITFLLLVFWAVRKLKNRVKTN